jgi:hypothetical protein
MSSVKWRMLLALLTAAALAGCGDTSASFKALYADLIKTTQDEVAILKEVTDKASMERVRPELRKIGWRSASIKKRFEALPAPSDAVKEEIEQMFVQPLQSVLEELKVEAQRIKGLPGGEEFLKQLKHL